MISGINSITITGIANRAELSKTQSGDSMLRFTLAGTEVGTNANGEPINLPFYRNITVFGRQADRYYPLLQNDKDMTPVFVHGHLTSTSREVNGETRNEIRIRVQELHILAWMGSRMSNPFHPDQRQQNRLAEAANHVMLLGNLTYQVDVIQTTNAHAVFKNRLAVNTKYRNYKGEVKDATLFIDITAWRELALDHQGVEKGTTLFIQGRLKQDSYDRADGQRQYKDYVEVQSIEVIERPKAFTQPTETAPTEAPTPTQAAHQPTPAPAVPATQAVQQPIPQSTPVTPAVAAAPLPPAPPVQEAISTAPATQAAPITPAPTAPVAPQAPAAPYAPQEPTPAVQPARIAPQEAPQPAATPVQPTEPTTQAPTAAPQTISRDVQPF